VLVASSKTLPLALTILTILPAALGDKGLIALPCILGHFSQVPHPLGIFLTLERIFLGPLPSLFPPRARPLSLGRVPSLYSAQGWCKRRVSEGLGGFRRV
jgi:hypothetical protein